MCKKTILIIFALCAFNFAQAQQQTTTPAPDQPVKRNRPTPEQMATRQSVHLQKMLDLTEDQKQKVYQAVLTRTSAMQKIHEKYGPEGDKKAMHAEIKPVKMQFVQEMNGILTPAQKAKWDEDRMRMKEGHMKNTNMAPAKPAEGGNRKSQKLSDDDDGMND